MKRLYLSLIILSMSTATVPNADAVDVSPLNEKFNAWASNVSPVPRVMTGASKMKRQQLHTSWHALYESLPEPQRSAWKFKHLLEQTAARRDQQTVLMTLELLKSQPSLFADASPLEQLIEQTNNEIKRLSVIIQDIESLKSNSNS